MSTSDSQLDINDPEELIHGYFMPRVKAALRRKRISKKLLKEVRILGGILAGVLASEGETEMVLLVRRFLHHWHHVQYEPGPPPDKWRYVSRELLWPIWDDLEPRLEAFTDTLPFRRAPEWQVQENSGESAGEAATSPARRQRSMDVEEANRKAMELAKSMGKEFFLLSERKQAKRIGCSWQTWSRTEFYRTAKSKRSPQQAKDKAAARKVVRLTGNLEGVIGEGNRNEVLEKLIAEQEADREPSPLEDDPPGQPRRVRCYKRS